MLEEKILIRKIREKFKNNTYKEISKVSGMNISRLFRIFNGSKISYLEAFKLHELIDENNIDKPSFFNPKHSIEIEERINRLMRLENILGNGE